MLPICSIMATSAKQLSFNGKAELVGAVLRRLDEGSLRNLWMHSAPERCDVVVVSQSHPYSETCRDTTS